MPNESERAVAISSDRHVTLSETLDRVLNKGAVVSGELILSVADVDLVYVGLQVVISSVDAIRDDQGGG